MTYFVDESEKPVNVVKISGTQIFKVDLNEGWEIVNVSFDETVPANEIDWLMVSFMKKVGEQE